MLALMHLSEQLAGRGKEPTVWTAAACSATAHYASIRCSERSSISSPAAGVETVCRDNTDLVQTVQWIVTVTLMDGIRAIQKFDYEGDVKSTQDHCHFLPPSLVAQ